jgi:hypothetical protein
MIFTPDHKIPLLHFGELRLTAPIENNRPAFIAAASGLIRHGDHCFVIGDDELHLGIFSTHDLAPLPPVRLLAGNLPNDPEKRKKAKPDFEGLALLPAADKIPFGALLALGSGSRETRNHGVMVALSSAGLPHHQQSLEVDLSGLYTALQRQFGTVNIEGAILQGDDFLLLQRGNKGQQTNAIVRLHYKEFLRELWRGDVGDSALREIVNYALGSMGGVPLGFSDATCLPDGRLLALAVAEDTDDAYADGATMGSSLCIFDRGNTLTKILPLDVLQKVEGITVWSEKNKTLAFVTDADDPAIPAVLYVARVEDIS